MIYQQSIRQPCYFSGVGIHNGETTHITLLPAEADNGIVFSIKKEDQITEIIANHLSIVNTQLATTLGKDGVTISTVEHLLSALYGLGVDNVLIEVEGSEIPIMDGSALIFARQILQNGIQTLDAKRKYHKILETVSVEMGDSSASLQPSDFPEYGAEVIFDHEALPSQVHSLSFTPQNFMSDIAPARTFGWFSQIEAYRAQGFARGASLENAIAIHDDASIVNPEKLRYENEFVRHKLLDAIGDMALLGTPLWGRYVGVKAGHTLHAKLLETLISHPDKWVIIELS